MQTFAAIVAAFGGIAGVFLSIFSLFARKINDLDIVYK